MELDALREMIGRKDEEIARLISERTEIARRIGELKHREGLPIRNVPVEEKVVKRYIENFSEYGLSREAAVSVSSALIKEAVDSEASVPFEGKPMRIAVVGGAGKMGAWTAGFLEKCGHSVIIIDPASGNGNTIRDCRGCDAVVVAVPIRYTDSVLSELENICGEDTLIFDLTSLKSPITGRLRSMASHMKVCSLHPMFGPSASSLYGRNLIICDCGCSKAVEEAKSLFDDRGGNIRIMDVGEHDGYMSYVLGLTHAVNIALFTVLERSGYSFKDLLTVSSTTFSKGLDTNMSVASEDPMLYYEIQHLNVHRDEMWDLFSETVEELKKQSLSGDPSGFIGIMDAGRRYFND